MSEQDGIEPVMIAVQHYAFAVAKRDTTHAEGSAAYRAVEAAIIAYGDSREAEGWHEGGNDGWNRAMEAEHPSEEEDE